MLQKSLKVVFVLVLALLLFAPMRQGLVWASDAAPDAAQPSQAAQQNDDPPVLDPQGVQRLKDGGASVTIARQTGGASFVAFGKAQIQAQAGVATQAVTGQAGAFWQAYGPVFGVRDAGQTLILSGKASDPTGASHLTFRQVYQGLPVWGGQMKLHFDAAGRVTSANGLFVPDISLTTQPSISAERAGALAATVVNKTVTSGGKVTPRQTTLMIYRTGLAQGVEGENHLAYEVETSNGADRRVFVYVDALTGHVLDQMDGIETLNRSVYTGTYDPLNPSTNLVWNEPMGAYTGTDTDVSSLIQVAGEAYRFFYNLSGGLYPSFDGQDAGMISVAHSTDGSLCPANAAWNGTTIQVCDAMAIDDVIAHEWTHAYTEHSGGLIYAYQPGALNEAYSDIFGETIDRLNGSGTDSPDTPRTEGVCASTTAQYLELIVNQPAGLAGQYTYPYVGTGSPIPSGSVPLTGDLARGIDGVNVVDDACETVTADLNGKIALVQRGTCTFAQKISNLQSAGATGVIIYNTADQGDQIITMNTGGGFPAVLVSNRFGVSLVDALSSGTVNATIQMYAGVSASASVENSVRWVMGEDLGGAIRDMWEPTCLGDPGKVTDERYACGTADNGGVHTNSSVINHAFTLLVDGGSYNGQTVSGIGLTKAVAIYRYTQQNYQTPLTDFTVHADELDAACAVLIGQPVYALDVKTENHLTSTETITAADCAQVAAASQAVELRASLDQCNYPPILAQSAPALCGATGQHSLITLFSDDFEGANKGWTTGSQPGTSNTGIIPPDWTVTDSLPGGITGKAYFAVNSNDYGDCSNSVNSDASSVRMLYSPAIKLPDDHTNLAFDHFVATEANYDGGNLWIQVNGGAWQQVQPGDITFNGYNGTLTTVNNGDPLAGQPAYTGMYGGRMVDGWGQTQVNLAAYAHAGDTVRLGFYFGQDGCAGWAGWYVDNVRVYNCSGKSTFLPVILRQQP